MLLCAAPGTGVTDSFIKIGKGSFGEHADAWTATTRKSARVGLKIALQGQNLQCGQLNVVRSGEAPVVFQPMHGDLLALGQQGAGVTDNEVRVTLFAAVSLELGHVWTFALGHR